MAPTTPPDLRAVATGRLPEQWGLVLVTTLAIAGAFAAVAYALWG